MKFLLIDIFDYWDFKFKHFKPNEIEKSVERITGANLDWYFTDWTQTASIIDYAINDVKQNCRCHLI